MNQAVRDGNGGERASLTPADWELAALELIAEKGVGALGVEPLARRLGITKGSFYWHFPRREQLLRQALRRWETQDEHHLALGLNADLPPDQRLAQFIFRTSRQNLSHRIHAALCASLDHPQVRPVMRRVTRRRMDYLAAALAELGLAPEAARHRARLTYSSYVGYLQLQARGLVPEPGSDEFTAYVEHVIATLVRV